MNPIHYLDFKKLRCTSVHSDGRKFHYFKDDRGELFKIIENTNSSTFIIYPKEDDFKMEETSSYTVQKMTKKQEKNWNLVVWYELFVYNSFKTAHSSSLDLEWTTEEQKYLCVGTLSAWNINLLTASNLAEKFVYSGSKPKYSELSLIDAPQDFHRWIEWVE